MYFARISLIAFLLIIYSIIALVDAGVQDGTPDPRSKDSAQKAPSPNQVQAMVSRFNGVSKQNNENSKNWVEIAKGRYGAGPKNYMDKYAEEMVKIAEKQHASMRSERDRVRGLKSQLVAEKRHDEAKQLTQAVHKYTKSWGRHYAVLHAVETQNKEFDRPKRFLEEQRKGLEEATAIHRKYVGDPLYRKLMHGLSKDYLPRHDMRITAESEKRHDINRLMEKLTLKGRHKEAKQLQQAHRQYAKAFGKNYALVKSVNLREEHPLQYQQRKGVKTKSKRPKPKRPSGEPFPALTRMEQQPIHVPTSEEEALGYTPSFYSG